MNGTETMCETWVTGQPLTNADEKKLKRKLRYLSKFYFSYFCTVAFLTFVILAVTLYGIHGNRSYGGETFSYKIWGGLFISLAVAAGLIAIFYAIYPTKLYDSQKLKSIYLGEPNKYKKRTIGFLCFVCPILGVIVAEIVTVLTPISISVQEVSWLLSVVPFIIVIIIVPIAMTILKRKNKKLAKALLAYGDKIDSIIAEDISNAKIKPFEISSLYNFGALNKKSLIRVISVEVAFVITGVLIFCLTAFIPPDPFNRRTIDKLDINVGYSSGYVYRMLGAPYDRSENTTKGENGREVTYGTWKWCSSDLANKIATKTKQLEKLSSTENFSEDSFEKMGRLTEQILNLELELSMTKCDYVTVNFVNGEVTQVEFKNDYTELEPKEVSVSKILYSAKIYYDRSNRWFLTEYSEMPLCEKDDEVKEIDVRMYLSDGSMVIKTVKLSTPVTAKNPTVKWSDEYGEHTFAVKFKD